jgi:hypothetical protein
MEATGVYRTGRHTTMMLAFASIANPAQVNILAKASPHQNGWR